MNCPECGKPLERRIATGLVAFACQEHGIWQRWDTGRELARRAQAEASGDATSLIEGFLWGRLL